MKSYEIIAALFLSCVLGLTLSFISVNLMLGCEDWSKPNCISPKEMLGWD